MKTGKLITIKSLTDTNKHTPYRAEVQLFSCVQRGDIDALKAQFDSLPDIITGTLSQNELKQYKYLAVSTITLATRYAIQGGLGEKEAYAFSDRVIMLADEKEDKNEIIELIASEIFKLTEAVRNCHEKPLGSPHIRKCIKYINENMSEKITVSMLADICSISPDYLSLIFKNETGENLSTYITLRKLECAKAMMVEKKPIREICKALGFSSQSHFITLFKKHYHMTPTEFTGLSK